MSGIAGIFGLDGRPVDPDLLDQMATAMQYRSPDGAKTWHDGRIGLVHGHFWTTPEDVGEEQPIRSSNGRLWITADARVDNRGEIILLLTAKGLLRSESPTDAEVILASYACWGKDCAQHLIGDYAFAIWDAQKQRLFAARDAMGVRQLYYTVADGVLYFATTIAGLIAALPERPPLNGPLVYEFLRCNMERWVKETVYAGLHRLPPAHWLIATRDGIRLRRYHVWGSQPPPEYQSDEEWIAGFHELSYRVLRAQVRSQTPVGILVGGGLDSSAIACAVHDIGRRQDIPKVKLVSSLFDHTPGADERQFFQLVQESCPGFEPRPFLGDEFWGLRDQCVENGYPLDEPEIHPVRAHTVALFRTAADAGCRVVLSGDLANYTLGDPVYVTPEAVRAVARRDWLSEVGHFKRYSGRTWIRFLLRAYAPQILLRLYRRALDMYRDLRGLSPTPWVRRLDKSAGVESRPTGAGEAYCADGLPVSGKMILRWSMRAYDKARLSALDVTTAFAGIEWRLPFADRRIIEFALRMPLHLACSKGLNRVILREAMRGVMPDDIRLRMDKPGLAKLIWRGLQKEKNRVECWLHEPCLAMMGFVSQTSLRQWLDQFWLRANPYDSRLGRLLPTLFMEAWLRRTFDNPGGIVVGASGGSGLEYKAKEDDREEAETPS